MIAASAVTWGNDNAQAGIDYLEAAANIDGGWAVLCFHQITNGPASRAIETGREVHRSLVNYVATRPERFWAAPFRDVFRNAVAARAAV